MPVSIENKAVEGSRGVLISPQPDQEGNKLQRQKILMFIYPIYNRNWSNINTVYIYMYIYINKISIKKAFSPSNKIPREVGRSKDLSAPLYIFKYPPECFTTPGQCREGRRSKNFSIENLSPAESKSSHQEGQVGQAIRNNDVFPI